MVTKEIEGRIVKVEVGSVVQHEAGRIEKLLPCDDWDKADFRWPNPIWDWREKHAIACKIEITGRSFQRRGGEYWVKVRMIFVGDGEPSTFCEGWLKSDPWSCEQVN